MIQPLRKHSFFKSLMLAAACLAGGSASAQYCAAGYNYPCGYWGGHMHIKSFSTTGGSTNITSTNTGCSNSSGYTYYSTRVHTGVQGNTVNFSIANCPYYTMNYKIWVDFNIDGDFTDAGRMFSATVSENAVPKEPHVGVTTQRYFVPAIVAGMLCSCNVFEFTLL